LVEKKADVALGALSVMAERENVIDFTVPYYDLVGISILMKKPKVKYIFQNSSCFCKTKNYYGMLFSYMIWWESLVRNPR